MLHGYLKAVTSERNRDKSFRVLAFEHAQGIADFFKIKPEEVIRYIGDDGEIGFDDLISIHTGPDPGSI